MHYQHVKNFLYSEESSWLYAKLLQEIPWRQVKYYKPERGIVTTPRLTWCCGFHQEDYHHIYVPDEVSPNPIPSWLSPLRQLVEDYLNQDFNFVSFSYYRDGKDSLSFRSEDQALLGLNPSVASVTLGNPRPFLLKEKATKHTESFSLSCGDLFVMQNNCQKDYLHSVPKIPTALPNISVTFRKLLNEAGSKNYYKYNYISAIL